MAARLSGNAKLNDVSDRNTHLRTETQARAIFDAAGLGVGRVVHYSYGLRAGRHWWPPLPVVRRLDPLLSSGPARRLGRGFLVAGNVR